MYTLDEVLKNKISGLCYGNRILLPFKAHFLKVVIGSDIIIDFSPNSKGINIINQEGFSDLYFLDYKMLSDTLSKFDAIKIVLVEERKNLFDFKNHRKIALYIGEKHQVSIEETDADILFIE
ncbi:MAG: hypothetical protein COZ80_02390 [Ignavibacteria bacterium CG_4_8_14_3_um_filter_37_9]|nr:hypothetical protein [Ignavibacteria bacterium]OIO16347.1 MAG: hypothetical protein AUJ54_11465 [Ignavibacteria bacterium CG1_02_37_35]PIP76747.1 MAG: hypothetical protein COW85_12575 [Ignavibacteria bacterium CG22_combo_CG10-13_8_21_14_all_37_15]PIS44558.1 MAG: hypothetical protein COT22_09880 [Ignavibacteria bacterium CG08_land_8_20_14_0_20_37_9]PIX00010.1 MAG: hypothetical protein COZ80_02390 [Ignavibacteria bacterium CG_4_8_14_3_um_filter_37_9]PIX93600.1 MAG: hypothetical protein COZ25_